MISKIKLFIHVFLRKNYARVVLGWLVCFFAINGLIYLIDSSQVILTSFISFIALFIVLRNEFYWWFYKVGLFFEKYVSKITRATGVTINIEEKEYEHVKQISIAVFQMAKNKTGSLITFQRSNSLLEYAKTGNILDSQINIDLLLSIFNTKSPLHDGGVIVENNRIIAAGCFFPISKNDNIKKDYGARHRAALGLSDYTDALTILTSEERGTVHIVAEKNISQAIDSSEELYDLIIEGLLH